MKHRYSYIDEDCLINKIWLSRLPCTKHSFKQAKEKKTKKSEESKLLVTVKILCKILRKNMYNEYQVVCAAPSFFNNLKNVHSCQKDKCELNFFAKTEAYKNRSYLETISKHISNLTQ